MKARDNRNNRRGRRLAGLMLCSLAAAAQDQGEPSEAQRERLDQAVQTLLISLAQDPSFQALSDDEWNLIYSRESQAVTNFGAIFDSGFDELTDLEGLLVLAVTPGSAAAEMGIRIGDRVRRVNGAPLVGLGSDRAGQSRAYAAFDAALDALPDGGAVAIELSRNGRELTLNGSIERWPLPAVSLALSAPPGAVARAPEAGEPAESDDAERAACGTLSLHHAPPHRYDLYPAYLTGINDSGSAPAMRRFHYLEPGSYRLTVNEVIPAWELRRRHTRFETRREAKTLVLEVEDGMVYHLGAKLLYDRKQQKDHAEYWKPVVWRMEPGYCKGKAVVR